MPIIQHLGTAYAAGGATNWNNPFFDTTYENGVASWNSSGTDIGNAPNHPAYSAGTDTYGDFIVFGPRDSRQDVRIYDAYTGSLVHTATLNQNANTYGIGMNSVNGKIYWTDYAQTNAYMIDVSSYCSNNSSGTKLTWSSSSSGSHGVTSGSSFYPWTGAGNDSRCDVHQHLYFPNNTGHPFHDHWMISGRSSGKKLWFFPDAGTQSSAAYTINWPNSAGGNGCHGASYDWQTNGIIVHDRSHDLAYIYGAGTGPSLNTSGYSSFQSYTLGTNPHNFQPEDMIIRRDGALVLMCSNTHKMTVYTRAS